jgi:hypothetical protein
MNILAEYIISRPMNETTQFITTIGALIATVYMISKTHKYVINNLNK